MNIARRHLVGLREGESPSPSEAQRDRTLVQFNRTRTDYPSHSCVHSVFEIEAAREPDRVALVNSDGEITYGELNLRANRRAHHLLSVGVGPETLVGIFVPRSVELIISILAVLKAGGAYLPLDPNYPSDLLRLMLEESAASVVITIAELLNRLPQVSSRAVLIDGDWRGESESNPICRVAADNLAYVMFTSGSTGRPKGVMVEHRSIVRLVKGTAYADFGPDKVFLQFAPATFDASTFEIWGALLNGAKLALMPQGLTSLEELGSAIREYGVTTLWLTAGLFHLMVDERIEDLRPLRQLVAGGDMLSVRHVQKVLDRLDCDLINGYGPTENTTFTCCHRIPRETPLGNSVLIGKPIANTQVYILDEKLEPLPAGEVGDLYAGGAGLARGYLNRPDLTAERFVASPFPEISSPRLYRTGDLAHFLPDGTVAILGRADNQVKIRGFRIELEEIEAALGRHPVVRAAVVIAREVAGSEKQLVAFIVSAPGGKVDICALRSGLEQTLPEYMVPALIFNVESLPLNENGKVDRATLVNLVPHRQDQLQGFVEPRTDTEKQIARILQEVLNVERLGLHDNFSDLGASSLQLVRAHSRLRSLLDSELRIVALFQNPTVATLAKFFRNRTSPVLATAVVHDRAARQREAFARRKQISKGQES